MKNKKALIVVDMQNDFISGSLAVSGAEKLVSLINEFLPKFDLVVYTKDWHDEEHCSFKENGGQWPSHCVRTIWGSQLHDDLVMVDNSVTICKGILNGTDSYSAFFHDEDKKIPTQLDVILRNEDVSSVFVAGVATDYCVKENAIDAFKLGYKVSLIGDCVTGVDKEGSDKAIIEMKELGIKIINSNDIGEKEKVKFVESYQV